MTKVIYNLKQRESCWVNGSADPQKTSKLAWNDHWQSLKLCRGWRATPTVTKDRVQASFIKHKQNNSCQSFVKPSSCRNVFTSDLHRNPLFLCYMNEFKCCRSSSSLQRTKSLGWWTETHTQNKSHKTWTWDVHQLRYSKLHFLCLGNHDLQRKSIMGQLQFFYISCGDLRCEVKWR